MIVRNEAPRMSRLLDSVKGLIDEVVISDTGSTDDTVEVIVKYCKENMGDIPCFIDNTPFKDFGFNRSRSITVAVEKSKCDYLLFLDADMKLVRPPGFSKDALLGSRMDIMSLMQKGCGLEYYNVRIMRRTLPNLRCVGVTHEHYASDEGTSVNVSPDILFIDDIGDGGSKSDKFPRDYRLLRKGLKDEPRNVRYMFYLAETCRHDSKFEESIRYYKMRVAAGGWDEEIYRALYGITLCYIALNKPDKADGYALRAFHFRPTRVESLYAACKWHRERGENLKAWSFLQIGCRITKPKNDVLFVETTPYEWGWDYEYSILAYYIENASRKILKDPVGNLVCLRKIIASLGTAETRGRGMPCYVFDNILENVKHYAELLPSSFPRSDMQPLIIPGFTSSTAGVVRISSDMKLRHTRQVDYRINRENGCYILRPDGCVGSTCTLKVNDDGPWRQVVIDTTGIEGTHRDTLIKGVEDIRFFTLAPCKAPLRSTVSDDSITTRIPTDIAEGEYTRVYGLGTTVEHSIDGKSQMILLEVNLERMVAFPIRRIPRVFDCEKNHAPIMGTDLCVHSWGPRLRIYDIVQSSEASEMVWVHDCPASEIPGWFHNMRGSSAGVPWPSTGTPREFWFICHTAIFETPRRYLHNIVRLDARTLRPIGFTVPFSFDDYKIEFAGGICFEDNDRTLVVGYSVFDSSSREIKIPVAWLQQNAMLPFP